MAFESFEVIHRLEGIAATGQEAASGKIAKIIGGEVGKQCQTEIGGRGAVGDDPAFCLLEVVGRQPVVRCCYKLLEESPGLPGGSMKER